MARFSLDELAEELGPIKEQHGENSAAGGFTESDTPATDEETAETMADITKLLLQHEEIINSPSYRASELHSKIAELGIFAKRRSRPDIIAVSCRAAIKDATALYEATNDARFSRIADYLALFEKWLTVQAELEKQMPRITTSAAAKEIPGVEQLPPDQKAIFDALAVQIQDLYDSIESVTDFLENETEQAIRDNASKLAEEIENGSEESKASQDITASEGIKQLDPFLKEEFEKMLEGPEFKDCNLFEVFRSGFDDEGNPVVGPFWDAIERAVNRKAEFEKTQEIMEATGPLESLSMLRSIIPTKHVMPNSTLMNALQEGIKHDDGSKPAPIINAGPFDMIVSRGKARRKEITAYTMIEYDNGDDGVSITPIQMTEYERQVSDAVISLYEKAKADGVSAVFTTDMIHRAMPGGGEKASPQQRGAITRAIEKMRKIHVYVDATEEMRRRGLIPEDQELVFDEYYFSISRAQCRNRGGGDPVTAYKITSEPIILNYARLTKQILTIPAKYIEIKKVSGGKTFEPINMTKDRQSITGYLVRQIGWIIHDRKNKVANPRRDTIQFDTVFKAAGVDVTNKQTAKRQRDFIFTVLDYEKAAGFISDYKKLKKGQSIYGVQIIP